MSDLSTAPFTRRLAAASQVLPHGDDAHGHRCVLYSREGISQAWTWLDLAQQPSPCAHGGIAGVLPIHTTRDDQRTPGAAVRDAKMALEFESREVGLGRGQQIAQPLAHPEVIL